MEDMVVGLWVKGAARTEGRWYLFALMKFFVCWPKAILKFE
jgi:hypothetical protein